MLHFKKMHGLGNDFVIFDARKSSLGFTIDELRHIADRRLGVGCDLIAILYSSENADIFARFYNGDGSESGACGNATRCVADIIMSETGRDVCSIEVTYGILNCRNKGDLLIEVDMGVAKNVRDLDLKRANVSNPVAVDMGNPHCVFFVDNLEDISVEELGAHFETLEIFVDHTNVEFVQIIDNSHLRQKTWERGVGVTQACGSGACAVAVAALHRGLAGRDVEVELDGGVLNIELRPEDNGGDNHVLMSGPVAYVFDGCLKKR